MARGTPSFTEQTIQYLLGGSVRLLGVVALLAAGDAVPSRRSAAARDWNHMIHREILRSHVLVAVVAHALCELCPPPIRGTQIPRLGAFALHVHGIRIYVQPVFSHMPGICRSASAVDARATAADKLLYVGLRGHRRIAGRGHR